MKPKMPNPPPISEPWSRAASEVMEALDVEKNKGLTGRDPRRRRERHGPNQLKEFSKTPAWKIFIDQLRSGIMALLGAAAVAALLLGHLIDGIAILVAIGINTLIGFFTELGARRSMESLLRMDRVTTKVRRDKKVREVEAENIVPGDILIFEAGDIITADARLLETSKLLVNESALTGEAVPVSKQVEPIEKDLPLADRSNMLFKGTSVSQGTGEGVVVATGMKTELGIISSLVQEAESKTAPIEKRLDMLGKKLIGVVLGIAGLVVASGIIAGRNIFLMIETGIALAVAAVPEGLPIVATLALARGMRRMVRRNALVRQLGAVQTLGGTTVIFTDKTGTLTTNQMTVKRLITRNAVYKVTGEGLTIVGNYIKRGKAVSHHEHSDLIRVLEVGVLCNNATLHDGRAVGDPMEVALLVAGAKADILHEQLLSGQPEAKEVSFDQQVRMMATYHTSKTGFQVALKGAPEAVLECSTHQQVGEKKVQMTEEDREQWRQSNEQLAKDGMRVLAFASKVVDTLEEEPYQKLTFLGLMGLMDPPREGVQEAIQECRKADVRVVMVTGDQSGTALGIARQVGIASSGDPHQVVHGSKMDGLNDDEILRASVFARVTPEQKLRLIETYQKRNHIVAMTGDGVNDAPALKVADVGVAMGRRGTQVAKEAADVVLKDDAFSTIVMAIEYGRSIFENIRKFVIYLLSGNAGEILIVGLASLFGAPLPLLPLQILYLNAINDVFPALALGVGQANPATMDRAPRDPNEEILTRRGWWSIALYGALIAAAVLIAFTIALEKLGFGVNEAVTTSFLGLALGRLWHVFNMRMPGTSLIHNEVTKNTMIWGALGLSTILISLAVYLPTLADILHLKHPGGLGWLLAIGSSLAPLLVGQGVIFALGKRHSHLSSPNRATSFISSKRVTQSKEEKDEKEKSKKVKKKNGF